MAMKLPVSLIVAMIVIGSSFCVFFITPIARALNMHSVSLDSNNNQFLSISDTGQTGLDLSDVLTFEVWVKFASLPPEEGTYFVNKRLSTGSQRSYSFMYSGGTNDYLSLVTFTDGSVAGVNAHVPWAPDLGAWYHVAVTKTGTTVKFYVNGIQQGATQTGSDGSIYNGTADFSIGHDEDNNNLDGLVDDVRIWSIERTAQEIVDDMNSELNGNTAGLVGYWKFNGESLSDATVNNNDLTNVNGATFSEDVPFTDEPLLTPEEQANNLVAVVLSYGFPKNIENAYIANLKKVASFIKNGKKAAALGQLSAFNGKLESHYAEGKITEEARDHLRGLSDALIAALQ